MDDFLNNLLDLIMFPFTQFENDILFLLFCLLVLSMIFLVFRKVVGIR